MLVMWIKLDLSLAAFTTELQSLQDGIDVVNSVHPGKPKNKESSTDAPIKPSGQQKGKDAAGKGGSGGGGGLRGGPAVRQVPLRCRNLPSFKDDPA